MGAHMRQGDRFVDPQVSLYDFADEVLARCPRCSGRAVVLAHLGDPEHRRATSQGILETRRRMRCVECALFKDEFRTSATSATFGGPREPYFQLPLWLQAACCGHVLWAYNVRHLDLLESYIAARLRGQCSPESMLWKLPAWLKSAKHRDEVLRVIGRMRATL